MRKQPECTSLVRKFGLKDVPAGFITLIINPRPMLRQHGRFSKTKPNKKRYDNNPNHPIRRASVHLRGVLSLGSSANQ